MPSVRGKNTDSTGDLLGAGAKTGGRVLYGIGKGLVNIGIRGLIGKQAYDDRKKFGSPTYSHGDIYSEAGAEGVEAIRTDVDTGGQGTTKKAGCVATCVAVQGTDRKGVKFCEKTCNDKYN